MILFMGKIYSYLDGKMVAICFLEMTIPIAPMQS